MKRQLVRWGVSLASLALLAACGGGGGGGAPKPAAKATTATVSGTAIAASAFASKASSSLEDVSVDVVSYKNDGTELGRAGVTTDEKGGFAVSLPLWSEGGYVIVTARKDGFTDYTKRFDYKTPQNLELQALLDGVNVVFANLSGVGTIKSATGARVKGFSFAVVRYPGGVKKTVAGKAIAAAKAAGGVTELQIDIPAASLPGVTRLRGDLQTFEPATESNRFPGSYTGVVNGKEGKMVSLAFDFMKITDAETGENIGVKAKNLAKAGLVRKSAETQTVVTRSIYTSSCGNLFIEDYDTKTAGHQVPVWSLNPSSGKWVFIGVGTVVDSQGAVIAAPDETSCSNGGYYLKIAVENSEFARSWWNLDHIVFDTPKEVCVTGKITFDDGSAAKGIPLSVYGPNLDGGWTRTDDSGSYTLTAVQLNKNSTDLSGTLNWGDVLGSYRSGPVTLASSPCVTKNITLKRPCDVSGKVVDSDKKGVPYRWLSFQGGTFYRGAATGEDGTFSALVACNEDIQVKAGGELLTTFRVDQQISGYETEDSGVSVKLSDLTLPNIPPVGYAYLSQYSVKQGKDITASVSAYDEDGDYPVSYSLKFGDVEKASGTLGGANLPYSETKTVSGLTDGTYTVQLDLTDSKNAKRTFRIGTVEVSSGNRSPVVTTYASSYAINACTSNGTVTLYGSAYDPDGDTLTGSWGVTGCSTSGTGYLRQSCNVSTPGTYTFTVQDSASPAASVSRKVTVTSNAPSPWVSALTADKTFIPENATDRTVTVTATPNHPDGIDLTVSWSAPGLTFSCPEQTVTAGKQTSCTFTIPEGATLGMYEVTFTANGCNTSVSRMIKIPYGNITNATVTVN